MDTVCIRHAVAMYCLTRYSNDLQSICLRILLLLYEYSGKTITALQVGYTRVSSSAATIRAWCGCISIQQAALRETRSADADVAGV